MDLWSLQGLLEAWPGKPGERERWRAFARLAGEHLAERTPGHRPGSALVPGLLQARLAAALGLLGCRRGQAALPGPVLTLGAHSGLEVLMLRDFGFDATGLERRPELVGAGLGTGLLPPASLLSVDYREYLAGPGGPRWPLIIALAPEEVEAGWVKAAARRLAPGGRLVLVAYWADLPTAWYPRAEAVVEGLMGGLVLEPGQDGWPDVEERRDV